MPNPHEDLIEAVARKIAALKMGLVNDPDGIRLPDDLWKQAETLARAVISLIAERTKDATEAQWAALDARLSWPICDQEAYHYWSIMHLASALWPKAKP